jgi:hypothetical protein
MRTCMIPPGAPPGAALEHLAGLPFTFYSGGVYAQGSATSRLPTTPKGLLDTSPHEGIYPGGTNRASPAPRSTCARAAGGGNLECLVWARANGAPWDEDTCAEAAAWGYLECLKWARQNGAWTCAVAFTDLLNGR